MQNLPPWARGLIIFGVVLLFLLPLGIYLVTTRNISPSRIGSNADSVNVDYSKGKFTNKFQRDTSVDYILYGRFRSRDSEDAEGIHATFEVQTPNGRTKVPILLRKQNSHYFLYYSNPDFSGTNFVGQVDGGAIQKMAIDGNPFVGLHIRFNLPARNDEEERLIESFNTLNTGTWNPPKGVTIMVDAISVVAKPPTR